MLSVFANARLKVRRHIFGLALEMMCFLGRLSFFADAHHAGIQGAGQGVEGCMSSVVDQASHGMGVGTIELHCVERSLHCSNEPSIPKAIGITAHF